MARRRGRRMAMAAAGLATAATPLLLGQQVAGAGVTNASDQETLNYVTNIGERVSCTAMLIATHDTDDASQPELRWSFALSGSNPCFDSFGSDITATYKDNDGVTRTVTLSSSGLANGSVTGASTATSVTAEVHFFNCDASRSASCDVTLTASPK